MDTRPEPATPGKPWVVRVPVDALDARRRATPSRHKLLMRQIIEGYCRDKAYCWPGNEELAAAYGCDDTATVRRLLAALEADGILLRVPTEAGRQKRLAILLLHRLDPTLPVVAREDLPAAVAAIRARAGAKGRSREAPAPPIEAGAGASLRRAPAPPRIRMNPKNDENVTGARAGGGDPEPAPEAIPDPIAPPTAPDRPGVPEGPVAPPPPRETPDADPIVPEAVAVALAVLAPAPESESESDPTPTPERVEAEIADLEAKIARQSPRPPSAMDRIRLKNLRDLRDGTWKADPLAGGAAATAAAPPAAATPKLPAWPIATGPVETADLIRRVASPGSGPDAVEAAAVRVAARLHDAPSLPYYRKAFGRVQSGELPVGLALSAWKQASGGTARCPGSVFVARLKGEARR